MRFKVGDKVKIREVLPEASEYWVCDEMLKYSGTKTLVEVVLSDCYRLAIDDGKWSWNDEMLEAYPYPQSPFGFSMHTREGGGMKILKTDSSDEPDDLPEDSKVMRHKEITEELTAIYEAKNHDYGDSFRETYRKLGIISAVTRITDKVNRLQSLSTKEQRVAEESIKDTLMDCANYCIMTIIALEEE
ncbi:DUF1599 domain-containing protein [Trichococcus collinsii]|uniref:Nucleotide modification associated domain-containing protein n=1 Tax=Trichococcus collinsii TaxID=157076 RepID=A0AB37ZYI2_9LACT|nr:DUF1599 domain-containing protein [Trichococcus collinsii]CZR02559.1 clostridium phage phictp1 gp74 [Trichococcus collinsii]SDZ95742.1 protein of unknown function [Trichococcus collinsii]